MKMGLFVATAAMFACGPVLAAAPVDSIEPGVHLSRMTMGYSYFNRPGASMAAHGEDVTACVADAAQAQVFDDNSSAAAAGASGGLVGVVAASLILSALADRAQPGVLGAGLQNCMIVRGWRVIHLSDAEGQALAALPQTELAGRLEPWISAEVPHGDLIRSWGNDAANAATPRFDPRPPSTKDGILSLKAVTGQTLAEVELPRAKEQRVKLDPEWPRKGVKPEEIAAVRPDAAVLIVRLKGFSLRNGFNLSFARVGPEKGVRAASVDQRPDKFELMHAMFANKDGTWLAMPVAPGRWRLNSIGHPKAVLNFCLGSPAVDVHAGETIYLGTFDLSGAAFGPDLTLEPVKAYLAGQKDLAERVRAAVYINGSTSQCNDNAIYALEAPGAPFDAGYAWGGARAAVRAP